MRTLSVLMVVVLVMCATLAAVASEGSSAPSNVQITIEVERQDGVDSRTRQEYELISQVNGNASITLGRRVPIPTQTAATQDSGAPESRGVTKYSYQEVGFTAKIETHMEDDHRLRISGYLDISSVLQGQQQASPGHPPVVEAVTQRFSVVVEDGASIRLLSVADSAPDGLAISLRAEFID